MSRLPRDKQEIANLRNQLAVCEEACTKHLEAANKAEQERDELRAQMAILQDAATKILEQHKGSVGDLFYPVQNWHIHNLAIACKATPHAAAQYVRGLEEALQKLMYLPAVQRLAAEKSSIFEVWHEAQQALGKAETVTSGE